MTICSNVVIAAILSSQTTTITNGALNLYTSTTTTVVVTSVSATTSAVVVTSGSATTSTVVVTSGSATTTTVMITSGGTGSYSPYPTTSSGLGRRRRRMITQSTQMSSHMPIGGCLVIGSEKSTANYIQYMDKQHVFAKHLPLGVKSISAVDGHQIDLYTFLRENKLSKSIYNQLVIQDRLIDGHYLTPGSLGCLEAHVRAWQHVVEVNRPMLIFEDDVHLKKELFDYILPYLLYSLPTNFSLLYFGNLVGETMQPKLIEYNDLLWKVNGSNWGTYTYLISPQAAATLLDFIYPVHAQVDSMIIDIAQLQSLNVFMSKQILVQTDNTYRRTSRTQRYFVRPIVIPRIFHFIWLTNNPFPTSAQRNIEQWKKLHPNWQIKLWTNESIYNSNFTIYNKHRFEHSAHGGRQASDIIRYEIVYQYGGIYADVDFEPLKNIEPLLHGVEAFVAYENEYFICNGIFGAIPGHDLTERLVIQLESSWKAHENETVNQQTGPYHMTRQVEAMKEEKKTGMRNKFQMFAPHLFFPYAWYEEDPGHPYDPLAFTVHHFRPVAEIARDAKEGY